MYLFMNKFKKLLNKHKNIFTDKKFKYLKYASPDLYLKLLKNKILKSLVSTNRRT